MIARIFHWNWIGNDPFPAQFAHYMAGWISHHPGWKVFFWRRDNLPRLINQQLFDTEPLVVVRSGILRWELMARFGGVYLDSDYECLASIEPLLLRQVLLGYENEGLVGDAILGAPEGGHPFFTRMVYNLPAWYEHYTQERHPTKTPLDLGPRYLTHILNMHGPNWPEIQPITDRRLLYPYRPDEPVKIFPETLAVHRWAGTWKSVRK